MSPRTLVMAVVNATPDSFSETGRYFGVDAALAHARELLAQGADLLDIGGESTRPSALRPSLEEELSRVLPVVEALSGEATISVDTMRARVARRVVQAGADIINDVSGGLADPAMHATVAELGVDYVCQHWRGHAEVMEQRAVYADVVAEVDQELRERVAAAVRAGVDPERIIIDPGFGFAKHDGHNWDLLAHLDRFTDRGHRVLVGVSRKRFLAEVSEGADPVDRDGATAGVSLWCATHRIWAVRTHEVPQNLTAVRLGARLLRSRAGEA